MPDWHEQKKFKAFTTETTFNGQKIILAKPTTFMNLSGEALTLLIQFYKIDPKISGSSTTISTCHSEKSASEPKAPAEPTMV